jgi:transposase
VAYRELFVVEIKEVLRRWRRGEGYRTVATATGVDRKTVRRYVEAGRAFGLSREDDGVDLDDQLVGLVVQAVKPGAPSVSGAMREHCRKHRKLIEGWLDEDCKGPKIARLLARNTGVAVPLRTLQRFIADEFDEGRRSRGTVRVVDPPPGQLLEVDFLKLGDFVERGTGLRRDLYAMLCTAGYSRHQFVWPCLSQTQQDLIEGLEAAWRFFGCVFPVLLPDNLKPVVTQADPLEPLLNIDFTEYTQTRNFVVDAARKRRPKDKATVERQVQYVRNDYFRGERFGSLEEARQEAERWCRETAGMRTHGTTRRRPLEVFEQEERPLLPEAPSEPYDRPQWTTVTVGRDHAVSVGYALYSVPYTVPEGELRVRLDRATVKLYRGAELVKVHPRKRPGEASIDPADYPPGTAELATRDGESLRCKAEAFGPSVGEYARRLLDDPRPWTRMRALYRLIALARSHGGELVDEACARALELDVVDVPRIDRMLQQGLVRRGLLQPERPKPKPGPPSNVIPLRFARDPSVYRVTPTNEEPPDAPA